MPSDALYEIIVVANGKPEVDGIYKTKDEVVRRVDDLASLHKYTLISVYKQTDAHVRFKVLERECDAFDPMIAATPIDEATHCETVHDAYGLESRMTLLSLLRRYFDEQVSIPIELLHNYKHLRAIEANPRLFDQGIYRLACAQVGAVGVDREQRINEITNIVRGVMTLAKNNEDIINYSGRLISEALSSVIDSINHEFPCEQHNRVITYAFTGYLFSTESRDWSTMLALACDLVKSDQSDAADAAIDGIIAEIIDGNAPIKSIVGYEPNIYSMIDTIFSTIDGSLTQDKFGMPSLQKLSSIMSWKTLPNVRDTLLRRIAIAIDGALPLTGLDRERELKAFEKIISHLVCDYELRGGPLMALAITRRAKSIFGDGHEDMSYESSFKKICSYLHSTISVINYALDLSSTDKKSKYTAFLSNAIFNLLQTADAESQRIDACTVSLVRTNLKNRISLSGLDKSLCASIVTQLPHLFGKHAGVDDHRKCVTASWTRKDKDETLSTPTSTEKWLLIKCGGLHRLIKHVDCPFTIGRTAETDLLIESLAVSREHARILFDGEQFILNDTSTNGSLLRLNGGPLVRLSRNTAKLGNSGVIQFVDPTKQGQKGSMISLYYQTIKLSR